MRSLALLGLLLAAPATAAAVDGTPPITGTRLDVSATGMVEHAPDVVTIDAGVVTQARTAAEAMSANAARMTATIAALRRANVAGHDIQTRSLTLSPQYRYADGQPPALTGYQASNRVAVRLRDLAGVGGVLDALVAAGANEINGPTFALEHPDAALDEARTAALASARARAELYARAAGLHVRRIVRIAEDAAAEPPVRPIAFRMAAAKAPTPVEAGEQQLSITLAVTFELD